MVKKITFSCPSWMYETYLSNVKNRSEYINELIVKGSEVLSEDFISSKQRIIQLAKHNTILKNTITDLQKEVASLRFRAENKGLAKQMDENSKYGGWDPDNLVPEELEYWREHKTIQPRFMHGQHKCYNNDVAVNIPFEEFKRRYEIMAEIMAKKNDI